MGPETITADRVVVCTGYWSTDLLQQFGFQLTIRPVPLYSAITDPALQGELVPLTINLDTGLLIERVSGGLLIAIALDENPPGYGHAQMLDQFAELARVRATSLADVGIAKHVVASVDMGGDGHPYVGLVEDGLWMVRWPRGNARSAPAAQLLARLIAGRPDLTLDITSLSPWRKPGTASEWMVASRKS